MGTILDHFINLLDESRNMRVSTKDSPIMQFARVISWLDGLGNEDLDDLVSILYRVRGQSEAMDAFRGALGGFERPNRNRKESS